MGVKLEHANLHVSDIDEMVNFLQAAMPEFKVRHDETDSDGDRWVYIGTDSTYIALNQATEELSGDWVPYSGKPGVNHLGYTVESVDQVRRRLLAAGYQESSVGNNHLFRRRVYFYDSEGRDWEFVEYLSDEMNERNDYSLPDS